MAELLRMPEIMANAAEVVLQSWQVPENGAYSAGDAIATVETEKAVVDVEAEADGRLIKTLVAAGAAVEVGDPIAVTAAPDEQIADIAALLAELGAAPAPQAAAPAFGQDGPEPAPPAAEEHSPAPAATGRLFASPLARRMAADAGLRIGELDGTGPGGRIIRRDVAAAIARRGEPAPSSSRGAPQPARTAAEDAAPATAAPPARPDARSEEIPHSRIRKVIAERLTESKQSAPHFYLRGSARVDALLRLRADLNAGAAVRTTVNDLVLKAAARTHTLVPAMNVLWTPDAVRVLSAADIAVAIAAPGGLVTPVLRSVDAMSVSAVAAAVKDYAARAGSGGLRQEEMAGATLTVTNLGMYGTEEFAAIINPPQTAILAVGAAREEPVVEDGALTVGTVLRVTLSVDHRPVDGVVAAQWMREFLALLENPIRILA